MKKQHQLDPEMKELMSHCLSLAVLATTFFSCSVHLQNLIFGHFLGIMGRAERGSLSGILFL
jgi:hypothetical protein